ncbi:MAG: hypothetical protein SFT94_06235 [Pseudanabaenaceae cyanobacterium bins.68]|nr:hypothetical protein [Pseudanabaenaceae cyanobacterium bins.68]
MANNRIEQLIAQIDATLAKPWNQALGGLPLVHYAKVSERRETLQKLRTHLATLNAENQLVPAEVLTACEEKVAKLERDIEQPVSAWVKENKPRYDFIQTQSGESAIAESERMIEKIVERITEKVYERLASLIANLDQHLDQPQELAQTKQDLSEEILSLERTKLDLEQQITNLQQQAAQRLADFNAQQQLHQDAYADSVNSLNQYLQAGLQDPLQAASLQVQQIQQAISTISIEPIFAQVNNESEAFLTEFVQRLQGLFGKTLPSLAEQIKQLRDQVELTHQTWEHQLEQTTQILQTKLEQNLEQWQSRFEENFAHQVLAPQTAPEYDNLIEQDLERQLQTPNFDQANSDTELPFEHDLEDRAHLELETEHNPSEQISQTSESDQSFLDWVEQNPAQVNGEQAIADLEKFIATSDTDSLSQITQILDALELDLPGAADSFAAEELDFADLNLFADNQEAPMGVIPSQAVPSVSSQWSLGIDFNGEQIRALLYDLSTDQQIELPLLDAIAEAYDPNDVVGATISLSHFKSILTWALPYLSKDVWQPQIQWQPQLRVSMQALLSGFQDLLSQLEIPRSVRSHLQYVVFATPVGWSDIYGLNLRQAALAAELVSQPEQVIVIDQAIASLLSTSIQNLAIVIDISWDHMCLALMNRQNQAIASNSYDYGGFGIIQDTLTQLLYSRWRNGKNLHRDACTLEHISFPGLASAEPLKRFLLRQELNQSEVGQQLWQVAVELIEQIITTHQAEFSLQVAGFNFSVPRRELENQVLQLFVQRIYHQLNLLLVEAAVNPTEIAQVFITGKFADFSMLRNSLTQKFSQAEVRTLQPDTTALGLAIAPRHFSKLNLCRQQYSDYFLLSELSSLSTTAIWSKETLLKTLQNQGVNVKACEARIVQILEGKNHQQLFPWLEFEHRVMFTDSALHRELAQGRFFDQIEEDKFRPNTLQLQLLKAYFELISGYLHQNLAEPLTLKLIAV